MRFFWAVTFLCDHSNFSNYDVILVVEIVVMFSAGHENKTNR